MLLERGRRGALALALLAGFARAQPAAPEFESWGAYDVRHLPLTPVGQGIVLLPGPTVAIPSGEVVYFFRPNGTLVGQVSAEGQIRGSPVVLRDGGFAVNSFRINGGVDRVTDLNDLNDKSITLSYKIVFFGPDLLKRGEYAADTLTGAITALSDGGAAASANLGRSLVFLGPDGRRRGGLSLAPCWTHPWNLASIVELSDGRLLLRQDIYPQRACVVSSDRKKAYYWTIKNGRARSAARWASPSWRLKSGVLVGSDAGGLAFMNEKGAVLRRVKAAIGDSAGIMDGRLWLTELQDGGVAVGSAVTGLVLVMDGQGRERWRFKASGAIGGEPLELLDGGIVVGSRDHSIYFLGKDGGLLGRYLTEGEVLSRLVGFDDGTILAAIGNSNGASHNLLLFTPTGRAFIPPASRAGKHCRVVESSEVTDTIIGHKPCPTDVETLNIVRSSRSWIESLCTSKFPGSRASNLRILGCRAMPPVKGLPKTKPGYISFSLEGVNVPFTKVAVGYDCEMCSDEAAPMPTAPASR